ncbi:MAG: TldD/PmbA family protein [Thermoplasmata archaeon]|nr:MAG: TldD/PmbA family protein [Thermoplasmata archaeon]
MEYKLIELASKMGVDYCDLRLDKGEGSDLEVKNGEVKKAVPGKGAGLGVRVLYKGAWGFSCTNRLEWDSMKAVLETAVALAKSASNVVLEKVQLAEVKSVQDKVIKKPAENPLDISLETKHQLLTDMDKSIRDYPEILTVTTGYSDGVKHSHFLNTEGTDLEVSTTYIVAQANLIAKKDSTLLGFRMRAGGVGGYEIFKTDDPIEKGVEAAKVAVQMLDAKASPSGRLPLVADPELTGVFVHEAIGHAVEADHIVTHESILEGRIGEKIADEKVTIIDDPTIEGSFGYYPYDDEGIPAQRKVLIENGVLKNYILNRETAYKLNMEPNGGARAESYNVKPLIRMSNTVILGAGEQKGLEFEELIEDIKHGIYAKGTRGGEVNPTRGSFQFNAQEAYLIENGEVTKPLRDVSLSGFILETLNQIDGLGKNHQMGSPGYCGKGQMVPVGDGGPFTRINEVMIGGGE